MSILVKKLKIPSLSNGGKAVNSTIPRANESNTTFFRRELPPSLFSLSSKKGKSLFKSSYDSGNAELFFTISGLSQSDPAFCGLSSLTIVLNSLAVDPKKTWKGVWRWYADESLQCSPDLDIVRKTGMTFDQVHQAAICNGLNVTAKRWDQLSYSEFIKDLSKCCTSTDKHMIINFSRKSMQQTGDGHFSPIAAFSPDEECVLVLDTARFKYPSYFASAKQLFDAMSPIDLATGLSRGYMILEKNSDAGIRLIRVCGGKPHFERLSEIARQVANDYQSKEKAQAEILSKLISFQLQQPLIERLGSALDLAAPTDMSSLNLLKSKQQLLESQVKSLPLYRMITKTRVTSKDNAFDVTLLILALPSLQLFKEPTFPDPNIIQEWQDVGDADLLKDEIAALRSSLSHVRNSHINIYCKC